MKNHFSFNMNQILTITTGCHFLCTNLCT